MTTSCKKCDSGTTVPLGEGRLCLVCGDAGDVEMTWDEFRPQLLEDIQAPAPDEDADGIVLSMLKRIWDASFVAGRIEGARKVLLAAHSKEGRLKRLRALWPPETDEDQEEFKLLLTIGAKITE